MIRNNVPKPDCETQYIYKMGFFFLRSNPQNEIRQSSINISRRHHFYYSILEIAGFYEAWIQLTSATKLVGKR